MYRGTIPKGFSDKIAKLLDVYAVQCPAYQSVKGCIDVTWRSALTESEA